VSGKRTVGDAPVRGRRVLVRVDFNVPQLPNGQVADDRRITEAMPTIEHLRAHGAKTVLMTHLGRPDGRRNPKYSLRPVVHRVSALLGQPVGLAEDIVGYQAIEAVARMKPGDVLMLENLRFHPGEEANDPAFAGQLSRLGDLFVEEAFGSVHRAHASTVGVPQHLPAFAGFLLDREVRELSRIRDQPTPPYVAIVGGAKVRDKLPLLASFLGRAQTLLIGGALAFPFLAARGARLGATPVEEGLEAAVAEFFTEAERLGTRVLLPVDLIAEDPEQHRVVTAPVDAVPEGLLGRDVGPETARRFAEAIVGSKTVFWNGPLGLAEDPRFAEGTRSVLAALARAPGTHVAAGGDSARIARDLGVYGEFSFISTGGGAALEFVEGENLPGLAVLPDAN
jgi:3-phosphoglycerate kinase